MSRKVIWYSISEGKFRTDQNIVGNLQCSKSTNSYFREVFNVCKKVCTIMFITALFVIVKNGNNVNVYQQKMGNGIHYYTMF